MRLSYRHEVIVPNEGPKFFGKNVDPFFRLGKFFEQHLESGTTFKKIK
jgi:hypothetical protein